MTLVAVSVGVVVAENVPLEAWITPVDAEKFCPVPPHCAPTAVPFHVPVAIVPSEVSDDVTIAAGSAVPVNPLAGIEGVPPRVYVPVNVPENAGAVADRSPLLNVWTLVQVFACPSAIDATTAPVVGLIVSVPSEFETLDIAPADIVLQPKPVPLVQIKALFAAEQEGTDCPDGVVAVRAPKI